MEFSAIVERMRKVHTTSGAPGAECAAIESAMTASAEVTAWLASANARLASMLSSQVSFPEKTIADCTRDTLRDAAKTTERANTLDQVPGFADALDAAAVTAGHVDAITTTAKPLTDDQRAEYFDRVAGLVDIATAATVEEFRRRLAMEARATERDDGMDRLERQRRNTGVRVWTDTEGMWRLDARFDPLSGVELDARLDAAMQQLFTESVPDNCPNDPVLKQHHLRALALHRLILDGGVGGRAGRREVVIVVDADTPNGAGGPTIDWGIPVELPTQVLAEICASEHTNVHAVIVRNGIVLHAPGELDLGRTTRLANPAQRRALRAIYPTCAIPGCQVRYRRCKLHHIHWWRHGGPTNLTNLLPLCTHHHTNIHDHGWDLKMGPNRELTITYPDGTIHNTSPPKRRAA